jgi:hypothetical protein
MTAKVGVAARPSALTAIATIDAAFSARAVWNPPLLSIEIMTRLQDRDDGTGVVRHARLGLNPSAVFDG